MSRIRTNPTVQKSSRGNAQDKSQHVTPSSPPMNPGDEAPAGTPGTGENVCRACAGTGRVEGKPCRECGGTGAVITGIGGA